MTTPLGRKPGLTPATPQTNAPAPINPAPKTVQVVAKPAVRARVEAEAPRQNTLGKQLAEQGNSKGAAHQSRSAQGSPLFARFAQVGPSETRQAQQAAPLEPARFVEVDASRTMAASGTALHDYVAPQLKDHVVRFNYDSMVFTNAFVDHLNSKRRQDPKATVRDAADSFAPHAGAFCATHGGSHCVGLAQDLITSLKTQGVPAYLVAALLPEELRRKGGPAHGHAAAMIRFENPDDAADRGFVLMDPGLNMASPIVIRPGQPGVLQTGKEHWTFTLDETGGSVNAERHLKSGGVERTTFLTTEWTNVDTALTKHAPLNTNLKVVSRDEDGQVAAALITDLNKRTVTLRVGSQRVSVGFDELPKLQEHLSDEAVKLLGIPRQELMARVGSLVSHEQDLAEARALRGQS